MAPALTEAAAGQAQNLQLPVTSSVKGKFRAGSPTTELDLDLVERLQQPPSGPRCQKQCGRQLCHAKKRHQGQPAVAPLPENIGRPAHVVNGNRQENRAAKHSCLDLKAQAADLGSTMNENTVPDSHNVDSRIADHQDRKRNMGLLKTNAGLVTGASSATVDVAESQTSGENVGGGFTCKQQPHISPMHVGDEIAARERFQANLRRRTERMVRRIHKLQTTQFAQHLSRQLIDFVGYQRKALQMPVKVNRTSLLHHYKLTSSSSSSSSSSSNGGNCGGLKADILQSENVKNLSTAALVNLVRKLESGSGGGNAAAITHQKLQPHLMRYLQRYGVSGAVAAAAAVSNDPKAASNEHQIFRKLDRNICSEIEWTSGNLLTNLNHLEKEMDSDATASSSGGESCDEMVVTEEKRSKVLPFHKRAPWKWAVDRAAVISRWTWLQAQVSDLEFRIHQTNDFYRQLCKLKEPLIGEKTNAACAGTSTQMNGFVSSAANRPPSDTVGVIPEGSCSRTCPLRPIKRRRLLRTQGLYQLNRKAAKLSTVRCGCSYPSSMCNMCCGRVNYVQTIDADNMSVNERVALVDSSFHPVLSFTQDTPLAIHFESMLRAGEHGKLGAKTRAAPAIKKKGSRAASQMNEHARKQCRRLKKNAAATLTAKLRKKLSKEKQLPGSRGRGAGQSRLRKKKQTPHSSLSAADKVRERSLSESSGWSSKPESPVPSPGFVENSSSQASGNSSWGSGDLKDHPKKGGMLHEMMRRRRGESAFDINNIVIPYSMAAATRVERLQYKEILTPKWRLLEDDVVDSSAVGQGTPEEEEDITDDTCTHRHDRCEHEERKRFMGYTRSATGRRTRSIRSDSRADSSGANTPDPMSPQNLDQHESPITTPPSTPAPVGEEFSQHLARRRTTSLSKRDRMLDDLRIPTPDFTIEDVPVPPWDSRTFPLADDEYEDMLKEIAVCEIPAVETLGQHAESGILESQWNGGPGVSETETAPLPSVPFEDGTDWNTPVIGTAEDKGVPRHSIVLKLAKR